MIYLRVLSIVCFTLTLLQAQDSEWSLSVETGLSTIEHLVPYQTTFVNGTQVLQQKDWPEQQQDDLIHLGLAVDYQWQPTVGFRTGLYYTSTNTTDFKGRREAFSGWQRLDASRERSLRGWWAEALMYFTLRKNFTKRPYFEMAYGLAYYRFQQEYLSQKVYNVQLGGEIDRRYITSRQYRLGIPFEFRLWLPTDHGLKLGAAWEWIYFVDRDFKRSIFSLSLSQHF
ncbi:MAG: hypothetical protein AAGF89_14520 [Bacteroidota bacterium]